MRYGQLMGSMKIRIKKYMAQVREAYGLIWKDGRGLFPWFFLNLLMYPAFSLCTTVLPAKFLGNLSQVRLERMDVFVFLKVCAPAILYFLLDQFVFASYFTISQTAEDRAVVRLELVGHGRSSAVLGKLDRKHFDDPGTYDVIQNGRAYDYSVAKDIVKRPFSVAGDIITYVGFLIILLPMGVFPLLLLTVSILLTFFISEKIEKNKDRIRRESTMEGRRYNHLLELLLDKNKLQELRIYGLFPVLQKKLDRTHGIMTGYSLSEGRYRCSYSFLSYLVSGIPAWGCLVYVIIQTYWGKLTLTQFFIMTEALENYVAYTKSFVGLFAQMTGESLKLDHYSEFLAIKNDIMCEEEKVPVPASPDITFQNVGLWYHQPDVWALEDISFSVPYGSLVSIVGPNGAGKSSLVKLLLRLYDPKAGRILVGGVDLRDLDAEAWYDEQSVLFQDYHLFALTVEENIGFSHIDGKKMEEAAKHGACAGLIGRLPRAGQTECGKEFDEQGVAFSGGESQRLCLARAFYKDTGIWALDEPSAAIDPISEDAIFEFICSQKGAKTMFVVSHRLSIAKKSDLILVLKEGRLVEQGTHSELMEKNGLYAELFNSQAEGY